MRKRRRELVLIAILIVLLAFSCTASLASPATVSVSLTVVRQIHVSGGQVGQGSNTLVHRQSGPGGLVTFTTP